MQLKEFLDAEVLKRDSVGELTLDKPDPLYVARKYQDEYISLICALFAYGNAKQIVKFLLSLDFSLLSKDEHKIRNSCKGLYYRFQNEHDITEFFITLKRAKKRISLEDLFYKGYGKSYKVIDGIRAVLEYLYDINGYRSRGYEFLLGKIPKVKVSSPYKRWNMYIRWMTRSDRLDMGLWKRVDKKDLLIPLDTHTFKVSLKLGLIDRKSYDFKAVLELTEKLKEFDPLDPVKYDFALYRIGQEKIEI